MIAPWLLDLVRCPTCTAETGGHAPPLEQGEGELRCPRCGRAYRLDDGYIDLMPQAAAGLEHAFARGLVHRDIKPGNLIAAAPAAAASDGDAPTRPAAMETVKLLDLGLARLADDDTPAGDLTATGDRQLSETVDRTAGGSLFGLPF